MGSGAPDGYGAALGTFPTHTKTQRNYWVDVVFKGAACGRAFDHGAARKPERYRRTDGNILSYRNGHRSTQLSVEKERGSCQRRNFGELQNFGHNVRGTTARSSP